VLNCLVSTGKNAHSATLIHVLMTITRTMDIETKPGKDGVGHRDGGRK